jgi:osmotically-inducible protein OsmY
MKKTALFTSLVLAMAAVPALAQDRDTQHTNHTAAQAEANATQMARPDAWVLAKIKTQFATSDLVDATDINVDVTNGVAKLTGTVSSNQEQREAVRLAQTTEGVRSVDSSGLKLMEDEEKARQDRMKNKP